jgi:DMSO/TMAO reductase YedYZ molybdopterin-dependent catalytic subunit
MPYPWVNPLLLAFVAAALVSGYFGLTNGDPGKAWILWLHSVAAFSIVALLAWKLSVVLRSLRRNRIVGTPREAFVAMAALFLFVLVSGLVWANAGRILFGPISLIELHQAAAVAVAVLLAWHVLSRRWVWKTAAARDRRQFLRFAAGAAAGIVLWQAGAVLASIASLPGDRRRFTGSYETGSFGGRFPLVSWLFDDPTSVSTKTWRLTIEGAIEQRVELGYEEVLSLAEDSMDETLDCTGGWYTTQRWSGVRLSTLLALVSPRDGWGSIEVESITGYSRRFSPSEAESALLATSVAGRPLSHGHGAPARLVMPDHRGFDWVKWVRRITVHDGGDVWQSPLPLQ